MNNQDSTVAPFHFIVEEFGPELYVSLGDNSPITFDTSASVRDAVTTLGRAAYEMEKLDGTRAKHDALLAQVDAEDAAAQAVSCGISGCEGSYHEAGVPQDEWTHSRAEIFFDPSVSVQVLCERDQATARGFIQYESARSLTAAELRAEADRFERFPDWLREQADTIEAFDRN